MPLDPPSPSGPEKCPNCGAPLPEQAPQGLCPKCLFAGLAFPTEDGAGAAARVPSQTPEELAPHFPQLEILECLGRGGMGVVYKARQKALGRLVALKLLAPERVADPKFAERFTHEAKALAALSHPNIVTIHDFGQAGGFYFLLMEFVDGVNLRQAMKAGRFTPEQALAVVPPVCEALQYAHEHGIVHRDIKPENLLLDKEGRVKIADFGIAKMLGAESTTGLAESQPAGTPQYMAPEQKDHQRTDHRADIYSLGVVLYEMLTGELPADKLQPPSRKVQIDVRLDEIVLRALEKTPELRYQTAGEFRTQVEMLAGGSPAPAVAPQPAEHHLIHLDGITRFRSLTALRFSYLALLGLLGFLGFLPGQERLLGLFGLFGLISIAYVIEGIARAKAGAFSPARLSRMTILGTSLLSLACLIILGAGIVSYELSKRQPLEPNFAATSVIRVSGDAEVRAPGVNAVATTAKDDVSVRVKHAPDSDLVEITAFAINPRAAADAANSLANATIEQLKASFENRPDVNVAILQQAQAAPSSIRQKPVLPIIFLSFCCATLVALPGILLHIAVRIARSNKAQSSDTAGKSPPELSSEPVKVVKNSWWPVILTVILHMILLMVAFIVLTFEAPKLENTFQEFEMPVPNLAGLVLGLSHFVRHGGFLLFPLVLAADIWLSGLACQLGGRKLLLAWAVAGTLGLLVINALEAASLLQPLMSLGYFSATEAHSSSSPSATPLPTELVRPTYAPGLIPGQAGNQTASATFGPVIECVLDNALDLDSGKTGLSPTPILGVEKGGKDQLLENIIAIEQAGWNVIQDSPDTILALGVEVIPLTAEQWDTLSAQQTVAQIKGVYGGVFVRFRPDAVNAGGLPATYAFQSREGATGILQITGFTANPRHWKVRYKLVQSANASSSRPGWLIAASVADEKGSFIRPFIPSPELAIGFDRLDRGKDIYDFVYHLTSEEELVLNIQVERLGVLDHSKSQTMRVSGLRSRFSQKGVGTFRVKQDSDDGWYFDLDSGAGYGLFHDTREHKWGGATVGQTSGNETTIFEWTAPNNDLHIKIRALIRRVESPYANPIIGPLPATSEPANH